MNNLKTRFFFLLLFIPWLGKAQNTCFQKVYTLSDTNVFFNDVDILEDSSFLLSGSVGRGIQRFYPFLCKLDKNGNIVYLNKFIDSIYLHKTGYSYTTLEKNIFDKYLLHYATIHKNLSPLWLHTRIYWDEINGFGQMNFLDTLSNGYFKYFDTGRSVLNNIDSSYFTVSNYSYLSSMDTANILPSNSGLFIIKFSQTNDSIIWMKRLTYSLTINDGPTLGQVNLLKRENGELLLICLEAQIVQGTSGTFSRVKFFRIDPSNGNVISPPKILHDTPFSYPGYGATLINNEKDLLLSYTDSDTLYTNTGAPQPYYAVRPAVARLDSNFNVVWKDTLRTYLSSTLYCGDCIEKFVVNEFDSSFVAAFPYLTILDSTPNNFLYHNPVRITKRRQVDGSIYWNRDYIFYPVDYYNDPVYYIHDAEKSLDGGYIFVGSVENFDSLQANAPGQLGYVLKTNCLGFLDAPQAGFASQSNDSLGVQFTNTSLMGGSYQWRFGDSSTLNTDEYTDAVFHQYATAGTYEVMLIAYGCNGANDTLRTTIVVPEYNAPEPPANPNITNYMALGPNPVKSGESIAVYVGLLPSANCTLSFYDEQGKLVLEHGISQSKSTNIIVLPFGAGMYQAVLRNGDQKLEVEKVVVY